MPNKQILSGMALNSKGTDNSDNRTNANLEEHSLLIGQGTVNDGSRMGSMLWSMRGSGWGQGGSGRGQVACKQVLSAWAVAV